MPTNGETRYQAGLASPSTVHVHARRTCLTRLTLGAYRLPCDGGIAR